MTLSHFEVAPLLRARQQGLDATDGSGDLGRTVAPVTIAEGGACFYGDSWLPWPDAERIAAAPNKCFRFEAAQLLELRVFSASTGWVRTLFPTGRAPTTVVAGFTMHRIQGIDPLEDTARKVAVASPLRGRVLDTATGLGYTAIAAAKVAAAVDTVELDPAAIELARLNPWSQELFTAANLKQHVGDVAEVIATFPDAHFARVLHDPPTLKLGGELYSAAFYRQLHRVLAKDGLLSHYIGDPASVSGGRTTRGVIERLRAAGFSRVERRPAAFAVAAWK
ncbi:MAG: methyltransferase [Planctomycetota bacterium]